MNDKLIMENVILRENILLYEDEVKMLRAQLQIETNYAKKQEMRAKKFFDMAVSNSKELLDQIEADAKKRKSRKANI